MVWGLQCFFWNILMGGRSKSCPLIPPCLKICKCVMMLIITSIVTSIYNVCNMYNVQGVHLCLSNSIFCRRLDQVSTLVRRIEWHHWVRWCHYININFFLEISTTNLAIKMFLLKFVLVFFIMFKKPFTFSSNLLDRA